MRPFLFLSPVLFLGLTASAQNNFTVHTNADVGDWNLGLVCNLDCGTDNDPQTDDCSLRAAIQEANACATWFGMSTTINLPDDTYTLIEPAWFPPQDDRAVWGDLDIKANVDIVAISGTPEIVMAVAGQPVFEIHDHDVTITGVIIKEGTGADGGNIYVQGTQGNPASLTLSGTVVEDGNASNDGGGIYIADYATVGLEDGSDVHENQTTGDGGGVFVEGLGALNMSGASAILQNHADDDGGGLFLAAGSQADLTDASSVRNNEADDDGGGIFVQANATLNLTESGSRNNVAGDDGGGIASKGTMTLLQSRVHGNAATGGDGGGVMLRAAGVATIGESAIYDNDAGDTQGVGIGGGISVIDTHALALTNSTISGNRAFNDGGGLAVGNNAVIAEHATIADNFAVGAGGGVFVGGGSAAVLRWSVVGDNSSNGSGPDCTGVLSAGPGESLLENGANCAATLVGTWITGDPMLSALAENGGPTKTHAISTGSPCNDTALSSPETVDQRGELRGTSKDLGAYERQ